MDTASLPLWIGFNLFVLGMLALDLGVFHRKAHEVSFREAAAWSAVWVALALVFNAGVWHWFGPQKGTEFLTGYLIEKSLSVDNIFVFALIFSYFAVPAAYQHRVLFWGILGALVMRAIFIAAGSALLTRFHWDTATEELRVKHILCLYSFMALHFRYFLPLICCGWGWWQEIFMPNISVS